MECICVGHCAKCLEFLPGVFVVGNVVTFAEFDPIRDKKVGSLVLFWVLVVHLVCFLQR